MAKAPIPFLQGMSGAMMMDFYYEKEEKDV
jgi:hypothetical protein